MDKYNVREEVLGRIRESKDKCGKIWYQCFGNFFLNVAGCPSRRDMENDPSLNYILDNLDKPPTAGENYGISDLALSKTPRQFWKDIDDAFMKAGTFEKMIEKSKELEEREDIVNQLSSSVLVY